MLFAPDMKRKVVRILEDEMPSMSRDFAGWFDRIFEEVVLGKIEPHGYKNNPRVNLRVRAAFRVTLLSFWLYFFLLFEFYDPVHSLKGGEAFLSGISGSFAIFAGLFAGYFWKEKANVHSKWAYLAGVYNEMTKAMPPKEDKDYPSRELLRVALAMDLLVMDMWAHRSFSDLFYECLKDAILEQASPKESGLVYIRDLQKVGITRADADAFLSSYQERLCISAGLRPTG